MCILYSYHCLLCCLHMTTFLKYALFSANQTILQTTEQMTVNNTIIIANNAHETSSSETFALLNQLTISTNNKNLKNKTNDCEHTPSPPLKIPTHRPSGTSAERPWSPAGTVPPADRNLRGRRVRGPRRGPCRGRRARRGAPGAPAGRTRRPSAA